MARVRPPHLLAAPALRSALTFGEPFPAFYPGGAGRAFAYVRDGSGHWTLAGTFGRDVDSESYGLFVAATADFAFVSGAGPIDVYEHLARHWRLVARLAAGPPGYPGYGAVAASGSTLVAAGPGNVISIFLDTRGQWGEQARLTISHSSSAFPSAVAIDDDTIVAGDQLAGVAYVYNRGEDAWDLTVILTPAGPSEEFGQAVAVSGHTALVTSVYDSSPGHPNIVWVADGLDEP